MEPAKQVKYSQRMNLSARLDEAMRTAGYRSQTALAKASGVSQTAVNRILKRPGKQGPDTATIAKLASACGVTAEWLASGIGQMTEAPQQATLALVYVTGTELQMLTHYREASPAGKRLIEDMAQSAPRHITAS